MLVINYNGKKPNQKEYDYAVVGNSNANVIRFVLQSSICSGYTLQQISNFDFYVKMRSAGSEYIDKVMGEVSFENDLIIFDVLITKKMTHWKNLSLQVQIEANGGLVVAQTEIVCLELSGTISVDKEMSEEYPEAIQQLEGKVNTFDRRITDVEEKVVEAKEVVITKDVSKYANENGVDKIIRKELNGEVKETFLIDKIHHESTLVVCEQHREENGYDYGDSDRYEILVNDLGTEQFIEIFGENYTIVELDKVYSLYYNQNGEITKGFKFGQPNEQYGTFGLASSTPNQVIRVTIGKYFEYDEQGNKVFDEHCAIYSDNFINEQGDTIADTKEITEEKQVFEIKTDASGSFYFDSDGSELGFNDTRFILYGFEIGEPAYDEYKEREIGGGKGGETYIETTYKELKHLRDNGLLVKGAFYRITDYQTTADQFDCRSAFNQFDIIVQALETNMLSENAQATWHTKEQPNELKSFYLSNMGDQFVRYPQADGNYQGEHYFAFYDNAGKYAYVKMLVETPTGNSVYNFEKANEGDNWVNINSQGITTIHSVKYDGGNDVRDIHYNDYFGGCKIGAWKIKYCLDNDKDRFVWALDGQGIVHLESAFSKGNILVRQPSFDGRTEGTAFEEYYYAWGTKADVEDDDAIDFVYSKNPTIENGETVYDAHGGILDQAEVVEGKGVIWYMEDEWGNKASYDFKNIQYKRYWITSSGASQPFKDSYMGIVNESGTLVCPYNQSYSVDVDDYVWVYTFNVEDYNGDYHDCSVEQYLLMNDEQGFSFTVDNDLEKAGYNSVKNNGQYHYNKLVLPNTIFHSSQEDISGYGGFSPSCHNHFGCRCNDNTFCMETKNNNFGDVFMDNAFGMNCLYNLVKTRFVGNTIGVGFESNSFDNGANGNLIYNNFYGNIVGKGCYRNIFEIDFNENILGIDCNNNSFQAKCHNIMLDSQVNGISLNSNDSVNYGFIQNIHIHSGVKNKAITVRRNRDYETNIIADGTTDIIV